MAVDVGLWTRTTKEFLIATRRFAQVTGNNAFLRGIRGEILTLQQILRTYRDTLSEPSAQLDYRGSSRREYDLLVSVGDRELRIDCKEKSQGDHWVRAHGRDYTDVQVDQSTRRQRVRMRTDYRDDFFYVFVDSADFAETGEAAFYVLSDREAKETIGMAYKRRFHGRKRIRNPESDDFWIHPEDLQEFSDNRLKRLRLR